MHTCWLRFIHANFRFESICKKPAPFKFYCRNRKSVNAKVLSKEDSLLIGCHVSIGFHILIRVACHASPFVIHFLAPLTNTNHRVVLQNFWGRKLSMILQKRAPIHPFVPQSSKHCFDCHMRECPRVDQTSRTVVFHQLRPSDWPTRHSQAIVPDQFVIEVAEG